MFRFAFHWITFPGGTEGYIAAATRDKLGLRKGTRDRGRGRRRRRRKRKKVSARTRIDSTEVGGSRLWKWNPRHSRPFPVVTKLESQGRQVVIGRSSSNTGSPSLKIARFVCENQIHGFHNPSPLYFFSSSDQTTTIARESRECGTMSM